ncbi:CLUMA_CG006673, isoform A [Clunio marinus]|uniref:CLUMA_CG006673, isoform A n=1 Tax=Clunio marinus TaxID=568069 RepID=A0A1J1I030_9DIPT|nr:CLUMA_CG006673, isoform A [Clunio marinus]
MTNENIVDGCVMNIETNNEKSLLEKSLEAQIELQFKLNEQIFINEQLRLKLEIERKKSEVQVTVSSSDESMKSSNTESIVRRRNFKENLETNSNVLMQYKYDDLKKSQSKAIKNLYRKNKQVKKLLKEVEIEKFRNIQLTEENLRLNKKVEHLCFRFLSLMDRRVEERMKLEERIEELEVKLINFYVVGDGCSS